MKIHVLLPAYNEAHALNGDSVDGVLIRKSLERALITKIDCIMQEMRSNYSVVVVDDGSHDDTAVILKELAERYPIHTIRHKYNRGLGETVRDGLEYIAEIASPEDIIVRMDCDDTHDPKYIPAMVSKLNEGYEVITTSRYFPGGGQIGVDWYRRTISRIANLLLKTIFPIPGVKEYTCGFRAYRASLIQDAFEIFGNHFIDLKGMGFTGTVEKMIKFKMMGARIGEIPFVLRYDQKMSSSKVVTSITTLGYLMLIAKYRVFWGEIGRKWKQEIEERRKRVYGPDGQLLEPIRSVY
jgi:dolichol-phosphate mannosyltransferase